MERVISLHIWTRLRPHSNKTSNWTTCSMSTTIDGESPPLSFTTSRLGSRKLSETSLALIITITIKALSTTLIGLRIKNSLMLPLDLVSQSWEKSQLRELLDLREHLLTQVTNSSHSFKLHLWNQMLILTLLKEKLFMKTLESQSGLNSGKCLPLYSSVWLLASIFSRSIREMVLHRYNGWLTTGTGSTFLANSKMEVVGTLQDTDIVTTMTTWPSSTVPSVPLSVHLTPSSLLLLPVSSTPWT